MSKLGREEIAAIVLSNSTTPRGLSETQSPVSDKDDKNSESSYASLGDSSSLVPYRSTSPGNSSTASSQERSLTIMMQDIQLGVVPVPKDNDSKAITLSVGQQIVRALKNPKNLNDMLGLSASTVSNITSYAINPWLGLAVNLAQILSSYYSDKHNVDDRAARLVDLNNALNAIPQADLRGIKRPSKIGLTIGIASTILNLAINIYAPFASLVPIYATWGIVGVSTMGSSLFRKYNIRIIQNQIEVLENLNGKKYHEALSARLKELEKKWEGNSEEKQIDQAIAMDLLKLFTESCNKELILINAAMLNLGSEIKEIQEDQARQFQNYTASNQELITCQGQLESNQEKIKKHAELIKTKTQDKSDKKAKFMELPSNIDESGAVVNDPATQQLQTEIDALTNEIKTVEDAKQILDGESTKLETQIASLKVVIKKSDDQAALSVTKLDGKKAELQERIEERQIYLDQLKVFTERFEDILQRLQAFQQDPNATSTASSVELVSIQVENVPHIDAARMGGPLNTFPAARQTPQVSRQKSADDDLDNAVVLHAARTDFDMV